MNGLPNWLMHTYLSLLRNYPYRVFDFDQASTSLNIRRESVRVILSELVKRGWLLRMRRNEYLILSPYAISLKSNWQDKILQREYIPIITVLGGRLLERYPSKLVSLAVFGSVVRGEAKPTSDLDILVIIDGLPEKYSDRVSQMIEVIDDLRQFKFSFWKNKNIFCNFEPIILSVEEASQTQPIYMDMVESSVIVYDKNNFLKETLGKIAEKLRKLKSERISLTGGRWFWRLKPSVDRGEVIEI